MNAQLVNQMTLAAQTTNAYANVQLRDTLLHGDVALLTADLQAAFALYVQNRQAVDNPIVTLAVGSRAVAQ